jgi:hypothetical protein
MRKAIDERLRRFGVKGPGREWLIRALHPAGETPSPGFPDTSACNVMRPEFRMQATIAAPPDAPQWDCMIWSPPGDVNTIFYAYGASPCDFSHSSAPYGAQVGVIRLQDGDTPLDGIQITTFGDTTLERGIVSTLLPRYQAVGFRHQFKSYTVHLIASSINDAGQVYSAQYPPNLTQRGTVQTVYQQRIGFDLPQYAANYYTTVLPTDETMLAATAPGLYMGEARDGVYVPLRLAGPTQPFAIANTQLPVCGPVAGGSTGLLAVDPAVTRLGSLICPSNAVYITSGTSPAYQGAWPFFAASVYMMAPADGQPVCGLPSFGFDTAYDNMNIGVTFFRGLSGNNASFGAALQIKVIAGLEAIPQPTAPERIYTEAPAPYDPKALEAYYAICMELKDAYPASYNSFETILDAIGSAASKVWDVVSPALTKVAPFVVDALARRAGISIPMPMASQRALTASVRRDPRAVTTLRRPAPARQRSASARTKPGANARRRAKLR